MVGIMGLRVPKHEFSPLPTEEGVQLHTRSSRTCERRSLWWLYAITSAVALLTLGVVIGQWTASPASHPPPATWSSCGNDTETAHRRGCSFDLISFAWQTPQCYDADLVAEFASWNNWTFYDDSKFTIPVNQDVALVGNRTQLFVKWDYHIVHCTFMWRQMHRAYERGWIDSHMANYNHTMHCQKMILMDDADGAKAITVAKVIYPECRRAKTNMYYEAKTGPYVG